MYEVEYEVNGEWIVYPGRFELDKARALARAMFGGQATTRIIRIERHVYETHIR